MTTKPANLADLEQAVATAETQAAEAKATIHQLEDAIQTGDTTVSLEDVEAQERLARLAELRVNGTKARLTEATTTARTNELKAIRKEIQAWKAADLAALLRKVEDAAVDFTTAVQKRNEQILAWRSRLEELEVGVESDVAAADQGLKPVRGFPDGVFVDHVLYAVTEPDGYVTEAALRAAEPRSRDIYTELAQYAERG